MGHCLTSPKTAAEETTCPAVLMEIKGELFYNSYFKELPYFYFFMKKNEIFTLVTLNGKHLSIQYAIYELNVKDISYFCLTLEG